eukprot:gene15137-biopygen12697
MEELAIRASAHFVDDRGLQGETATASGARARSSNSSARDACGVRPLSFHAGRGRPRAEHACRRQSRRRTC